LTSPWKCPVSAEDIGEDLRRRGTREGGGTPIRGRVLVIGIGNPGRTDDGLGPALVARLAGLALPGVDTDANYQLNIEDAEAVSRYETVVFVDASVEAAPPYEFTELRPTAEIAMTTHELRPGAVLALCEELYGRRPRARTLAIRGYAWELREGLSAKAEANLAAALDFLVEWLRAGPANGPLKSRP